MRFLVDECLPARFAGVLRAAGHDAVHVSDMGRLAAAAPHRRAQVLLDNLDQVADDLRAGAVVVIGDDRIRIRMLPLA